jgi:hypothetical protein
MMNWISNLVSEGFIWGVGITRPSPGKERRAALYITGILVFTVVLAASMFALLSSRIF